MPKISNRGVNVPASPIRKLAPFAATAKKLGRHVYHLNIGQPDIKTPELALRAVRKMDRTVIEYSPSDGFESYKNKLSSYYQNNNILIEPSQLLVTTGGSEAILFGMNSCLDPGDEVIVPEPFYANYNGFAVSGDVVVKPIVSSIDNGFSLPPISEIENLITPKTKAILICNPNNPTGYLYSQSELEQLRELVLKHDLFLFADEVYREFCYDDRQHTSILELEGLEKHSVVMDSISKRYSACGARIGTLVTRNKDVLDAALRFAQARLSPPTLGQILAEAALDTPASYFQDVINEYVRRRNLAIGALKEIDGVIAPTPQGAFYIMSQLPVDSAERFCQWLLQDFEHNNKTVMLAPGTGFYATPGGGQQEVRIAYVLNESELGEAMECLSVALDQYPWRTTEPEGS